MGKKWKDDWKKPTLFLGIATLVVTIIFQYDKTKTANQHAKDEEARANAKEQMANSYLDTLEQRKRTTDALITSLNDSIRQHSVMLNSTDRFERDRAQRQVDGEKEQLDIQKGIQQTLAAQIDDFHKNFK